MDNARGESQTGWFERQASARERRPQWWIGTPLAAVFLLAGCGGVEPEPAKPEVGRATFTVLEFGGDLDLDGYQVVIDAGSPWTLPGNLAVRIGDLPAGPHEVRLQGVESNCAPRSSLTARFTVTAGTEANVEFVMDCVATGILVTLEATGIDGPEVYPVIVDGTLSEWIHPSHQTRITRLRPGTREVQIGSVPSNCGVAEPRSRPVTLESGDLVPVAFGVTCLASYGVLRVHGEIHGDDIDPNGYELDIDTSPGKPLGPLGDSTSELLISAGTHTVTLDGVAKNCSVNESPLRRVDIPGGGLARDTLDITYGISCQRAYRFAFVREGQIALVSEDGTVLELTETGGAPSWSPDGNTLAYACSSGICRLGLHGARYPSLPTLGPVRGVAWSPDGTRLAYAFDCETPDCQGGLALVNLDGSAETRLPLPSSAWSLQGVSWSPDGTRLAFGCTGLQGSFSAICTIATDGSDFRRLPSGGGANPSWSPDGAVILFTGWGGDYTPYLINADGWGPKPIKAGLRGQGGGWISNDRILVAEMSCDSWYGCSYFGISSMRIDGSGRVALSVGPDTSPVWRP